VRSRRLQNNISRLAELRSVDQQTGRIGIEAKFGNKVAKIAEGCTDSFVEYPDKKQEWEERKSSYIERLWNEPPETLLVSVADKLYNARAILKEYRQNRFRGLESFQARTQASAVVFRRTHQSLRREMLDLADSASRRTQRTVKELTQISATDRISEPGQTA
jgi:(p)ppGpp synthase/HD superfamily hydrolase